MRETKNLEYKQDITRTFLKTVSAYANYGTGEIVFGIKDNGDIIGMNDPIEASLAIEHMIQDTIDPIPTYHISIDKKTSVITLTVEEGYYKPYFYKNKAYRRYDASTIEVDRIELRRLILEGDNMSYEQLSSSNQELTFNILETKIKDVLHIHHINKDILKTLELYNEDSGYNIAAELLSDQGIHIGIDAIRFGEDINTIQDRQTYVNESILLQYDHIVSMYQRYYQYEHIEGSSRVLKERIPEIAFREAIANALVHRMWDINSHIRIAMYDDKIEVYSPGGLVKGVSKDDYLSGGLSIPRNSIICNIFFRLHMIERFGTGIRRINETYRDYQKKPQYDISENMIKITLPIISHNNLAGDLYQVYNLLEHSVLSSSDIVKSTGFGKNKVVNILNQLVREGYIQQIGTGRGTKYKK